MSKAFFESSAIKVFDQAEAGKVSPEGCYLYPHEIFLQRLDAIIIRVKDFSILLDGKEGTNCSGSAERTNSPCGVLVMARNAQFIESIKMMEQQRDNAMKLCADHGITVRPYAGGWWLVGERINRVFGELAGLCVSDLNPLPVMAR